VFQKIIEVNYSYPEGFDADAKDLISRMLKFEPFDRLGAGSDKVGLGYEALKAHKFFNGINFNSLFSS